MTPEELLKKAKEGDRRSLSRLVSAIESGERLDIAVEKPWTLGITGAPGVGKSTLIGCLITEWVKRGESVAVLAVDPSSPRSGGALLGDRMRMASADSGDSVFVRSLATRNHPGGVVSFLTPMISLLHHCGWTRILIETVGSGQSEIRIVAFAERLLLIEGPDRGDIIQAEKAGIIELADLIAVNKADLPNSQKAADSIRASLSLSDSSPIEVKLVSSMSGMGVTELVDALDELTPNEARESLRMRERLLSSWDSRLLQHPQLNSVIESLVSGTITLDEAVEKLV